MFSVIRSLPRSAKRSVMMAADALVVAFALWASYALKNDTLEHDLLKDSLLYLCVVATSITVFAAMGLYRSIIRYIGPRALNTIVAGTVASAVALQLAGWALGNAQITPSLVAIYGLLSLLLVGASRYVAKWVLLRGGQAGAAVVIYGAGDAGMRLARALELGSEMQVVAFLDDKKSLHGSLIDGIPVLSIAELPRLVLEHSVSRVLLAVPSASRRRRAEIIRKVETSNVQVLTIPNLAEIASGKAKVSELREVDISDLLGRDPVPPHVDLLDSCIRGKTVMVTGAGGSIGSELCRQIVQLEPKRLLLFEMSEFALYQIERELRELMAEAGITLELCALLGNVQHRYRVREVLQTYGVQTVYHAAAYKHVPIVEQNVVEGVHNNVIGTWYSAEAAIEAGVETFVLISTDKAVNPTNVMGATKRMAEMVLQGLHNRGTTTRFCMVRFGNVLESSGSVVPLFREQIRRGGPVTVTHPDVIRYFMTIPEASQLVLQAGAMAEGGDVFVLDMGKPVRIADLARRMVHLSGLTVRDEDDTEGDIEICYTGLRPAEKLFEELLIGSNVSGTEHPSILRAVEHSWAWHDMQSSLQEILMAMGQFDVQAARDVLGRCVREYKPAADLVDLVWSRRERVKAEQAPSNVTPFPPRRPATGK